METTVVNPSDLWVKRQSITAVPLVNFQVSEPVLTPAGPDDRYGYVHTQTLMEHVFINSYGNPFVGELRVVLPKRDLVDHFQAHTLRRHVPSIGSQ